jgi:aspartate kinase
VDKNDVKICLRGLINQPGVCMQVFSAIAEANINVDMIIQSPTDGHADLSFTIPIGDLGRAQKILTELKKKLGYTEMTVDRDIAKVSLVGLGMRSHVGVAAKAFTLLAQNKINIDMISTSEIKLSMIVKRNDGDTAVRVLHDGYQLNEFPF